MRTRIHVLLLALPLLAVAAACGADEESDFPTGTYESVAVQDNVMVFHEDGTFDVSQGPLLVAGTYSIKGDELKILTDSFCADTPEATYTWSWDGTTLGMTATQDDCEARSSAWSGGLTPTFPRTSYLTDPGGVDETLMTLNPDGTWRWSIGSTDASGTYQVRGDTLTWLTDSYCRAEAAELGTYTWAWDGTTLTLAEVQDECASRVPVATAPKVLTTAAPPSSTS